jgi:hypothetical protein
MVASEFIRARLPLALKRRVQAVAERQLLSESAWLKRVVIRELQAADGTDTKAALTTRSTVEGVRHNLAKGHTRASSSRVYVRLRSDDRLLLDARAEARGVRPATYAAVLLRAHLRRLAPLAKDELLALKHSIRELAAIGRNINQIARAANAGGRLPGSARIEFRAMLKVCEALRENTKALLKANLASWKSGHGEDV